MRPIKQDDDVQGENFSKAKDFMIEQIKVYNQKINKDDSDDDFDDDSDDDSDNDAQFNPHDHLMVFMKDKYIVDKDQGSIDRATWWEFVRQKKFRINSRPASTLDP